MIDHYADEIRGRPYCPGCRWILGAATALGILSLAGLAWAQEQIRTCFPVAELHQELAAQYHEAPVLRAVTGAGMLTEIWASEDGKTWTQIVVSPQGTACVIGAGTDAEVPGRAEDGAPA